MWTSDTNAPTAKWTTTQYSPWNNADDIFLQWFKLNGNAMFHIIEMAVNDGKTNFFLLRFGRTRTERLAYTNSVWWRRNWTQ